MIRIEAGTFVMGKDTEGKGDRPAHKVKVTKAFLMDRTEVTAEAYGACIEAGACERRTLHVGKKIQGAWGCNQEKVYASHPANCVDRQQAAAYCAWMKKRLPTEAEWEYAARGTDERDFPWGSTTPTSCAQGVISGVSGACGERKGTFPVASAPEGKSPSGLHDMAGNVWEWVADDYAPYPDSEVIDPMITVPETANPTKGVLRGGSWDYGAQAARTTYRLPFVAEAGNGSIGVRCARNAD
jgi:formylglycine-generating enzyme required for sulfatase activity